MVLFLIYSAELSNFLELILQVKNLKIFIIEIFFRINKFFSQKILIIFFKKKRIKQRSFDLITSFAIFYDINNPNLFCKEIHNLLNPKGYWVVEFSYLPLMLKI